MDSLYRRRMAHIFVHSNNDWEHECNHLLFITIHLYLFIMTWTVSNHGKMQLHKIPTIIVYSKYYSEYKNSDQAWFYSKSLYLYDYFDSNSMCISPRFPWKIDIYIRPPSLFPKLRTTYDVFSPAIGCRISPHIVCSQTRSHIGQDTSPDVWLAT